MNKKVYQIAFQLGGKVMKSYSKTMGKAPKDIGKLNKRLQRTQSNAKKAANAVKKIGKAVKIAGGVAMAVLSLKALKSVTDKLAVAAREQLLNEKKLETVLKQRTNATDDQIQSVLKLTSAQQQLGVIGDEVQIAGAQQLGTFVKQTKSVETLIPAMNNLLAQQKGLSASSGDAVNIGNMLGKVMNGQLGALSRVGISFSKAQEKVLKYGSEQQKAAMLAKVIQDNVGDMNKALAQTDSGKIQQAKNALGDYQEKLGMKIIPLQAKFAGLFLKALPTIEKVTDFLTNNLAKGARFTFGIISKIFKTLQPYLNMAKTLIKENASMISRYLSPIISNVVEVFKSFKGILKDVFVEKIAIIKTAIPKVQNIIKTLMPTIEAIHTALKKFVIVAIQVFGKITKVVHRAYKKIMPILLNIVQYFVTKLSPIITKVINFIATTVLPKLTAGFQKLIPKIEKIINTVIEIVQALWTKIKPVIDFLVSAFEFAWPYIEKLVVDVIGNISNVIDGLMGVIQGIVDFVAGVFTGDWERAWEGVKGVFKSVFDTLGNIFKGPINVVIGLINGMIDHINSISLDIPDWIPDWLGGGKTLGFNIGNIPYLAKGSSNFPGGLAMVGEQGRELVNLPRHSQVIPNRRTDNILNNIDNSNSTNQSMPGIIYNPTIVIQGNATEEDVLRATELSFEKFERFMDKYIKKNSRLAF